MNCHVYSFFYYYTLVSEISISNAFGFTDVGIESIGILESGIDLMIKYYTFLQVEIILLFVHFIYFVLQCMINIIMKIIQFVDISATTSFALTVYDFLRSNVDDWGYRWECGAPNNNNATDDNDCFAIGRQRMIMIHVHLMDIIILVLKKLMIMVLVMSIIMCILIMDMIYRFYYK